MELVEEREVEREGLWLTYAQELGIFVNGISRICINSEELNNYTNGLRETYQKFK